MLKFEGRDDLEEEIGIDNGVCGEGRGMNKMRFLERKGSGKK